MNVITQAAVLLMSLFLLTACEGIYAVTKVALQQLPKKEMHVDDLFPENRMAQKLASAASEGDLEKVDELIVSGANPNAIGEHGITVVGWLLYRPNRVGLQRLFEHGADPNAIWDKWDTKLNWEWSFIHLATELSPRIGVGYLQLALDMGGDPNLMVNHYYESPIMITMEKRYLPAFAVLYTAGAKLNYPVNEDSSPLMRSINVGNFELCLFLLEHGADYMQGVPYDWAMEYAKTNDISGPVSATWSSLLHVMLYNETALENMWFWRCIDYLEKKGMDFAIPAETELLRPTVLDTTPTAYELEIEKIKRSSGESVAM